MNNHRWLLWVVLAIYCGVLYSYHGIAFAVVHRFGVTAISAHATLFVAYSLGLGTILGMVFIVLIQRTSRPLKPSLFGAILLLIAGCLSICGTRETVLGFFCYLQSSDLHRPDHLAYYLGFAFLNALLCSYFLFAGILQLITWRRQQAQPSSSIA